MNIDEVIDTYIKLREQKAQKKAEMDAVMRTFDEGMEKLEGWLKLQADKMGVTQFKSPSGTAFFKTDDYVNIANWEAFKDFVIKNQAYDMLEKRASKVSVRHYIDSNGSVPPGLNYNTRLVLNVRKPTANPEPIYE